jgi:hypothetical protein
MLFCKVLYLLAACQKYEMDSVQLCICVKVKLGEFPAPRGAEAFPAYAIAGAKGLIPEMESAASQSLNHPMTFQALGEELRLFEGSALRNLASFRKRCRDNLITSLEPFFKSSGPSGMWVGCLEAMPLPRWLNEVLTQNRMGLILQNFTYPLDIHKRIRREYLTALQSHEDCNFCLKTHIRHGSTFCAELEKKLAQALHTVNYLFYLPVPRDLRFLGMR